MKKLLIGFVERRSNRNSVVALTGALETSPHAYDMDVIYLRGDDPAAWIPEITRAPRALIGFSFMTADLIAVDRDLTALRAALRGVTPAPLVVAGGSHPSGDPAGALALGFDAVALGEGERVILALADALITGAPLDDVPGLAFTRDGELIRTARPAPVVLDEVPPFAPHTGRFGPFEISRGCPWACRYCQTTFMLGGRMRHRSVAHVAEYARRAHEDGVRDLRVLTPDAFAYGSSDGRRPDLAQIEALLVAVSEVFGREHVFFGSFPSEVRPENVTPEILALVTRLAGNDNIVMGAQTGSPRMLERLHRGHTVDDVLRAVARVREHGLKPIVDFLHALPGETPEDQAATRALMERLTRMGAVVHAHVFMPLPGTPLWGADPARIDPATRALLTRLSGTGRQSGKWQAQERTVIATERFLGRAPS